MYQTYIDSLKPPEKPTAHGPVSSKGRNPSRLSSGASSFKGKPLSKGSKSKGGPAFNVEGGPPLKQAKFIDFTKAVSPHVKFLRRWTARPRSWSDRVASPRYLGGAEMLNEYEQG